MVYERKLQAFRASVDRLRAAPKRRRPTPTREGWLTWLWRALRRALRIGRPSAT